MPTLSRRYIKRGMLCFAAGLMMACLLLAGWGFIFNTRGADQGTVIMPKLSVWLVRVALMHM
ncbi:MAG: hypothetical protein IT320_11690 [Anaerolineae bacterium]|nr:hypothetical protein [Anaerolineae bacterium]